jgi:hypothetical protein
MAIERIWEEVERGLVEDAAARPSSDLPLVVFMIIAVVDLEFEVL